MRPEIEKSKQRLVIAGNGMSSVALLNRLVTLGSHRNFKITVVGEEPRAAYDRVHLTTLLNGKTPRDLELRPPIWYEQNGIDLLTGVKATSLDRGNRRIELDSGEFIPYDLCILATGSRPFVPPIEGTNLPRVFLYRTIENLQQIRECAGSCRTAAVMGGGLLGLEAAKALFDLGLETHVFEMAPNLMPRQLDAKCAELLKEKIESLGVRVHLLRTTTSVRQVGTALEIGFANSDSLVVDMLVISAGIRPRDELAREAGLGCGARGGIAVDGRLQTADPRIYALGECASFADKLYGLVGPCYQMAEVLADNLTSMAQGHSVARTFEGASEAAQLKLLGVEVTTLGAPIGQQEDCVLLSRRDPKEQAQRTLILQRRKVVGAIGVGPWSEREQISDLIAKGRGISSRRISSFETHARVWPHHDPMPVAQWSESSTVCSCLRVSRGQLSSAIQGGCGDVESLMHATGASTVCGSCRPLLATLLGDQGATTEVVGWRTLLIASAIAIALVMAFSIAEPFPFALSVQSLWHQVDELWRSPTLKQISGFTLLAISLAALVLSLRKRWSWFRFGEFGFWRSLHGVLGLLTLVGFLIHTGLHMGRNFTLALAVTFLALNLLGSVTGIAAALECKLQGSAAQWVRHWRPRLTRFHVWLFWPLPVLVLFHIISVYYY